MIAVLDYGAGNLTSVRLAFEHIGVPVKIAQNTDDAADADRIVFPGVGSAASGMAGIRDRGFDILLKQEKRPVLAICLGMQLLFEYSAEDGGTAGLGLIPGTVEPFMFNDPSVKIPHMGWNTAEWGEECHPVLKGIGSGSAFYFVHSFYKAADHISSAGTTEYAGFSFASIAAQKNLFAVQFHPERSGQTGLLMLKNFLSWNPSSCC